MTHPYNLDATTAWHALIDAERWIRPTIEAEAESGRTAHYSRSLSQAAIDRRGELHTAARYQTIAARINAGRAGLTDTGKMLGATPAPIRPELLDAPHIGNRAWRNVQQIIREAADERDELQLGAGDSLRYADTVAALRELDPWRAQEAAHILWPANQAIRDTCGGVQPSHVPYEAPCPRCDTYGLVWETYSPDPADWTILCTRGCRCAGPDCPCLLPIRVRGLHHRWEPASVAPAPLRFMIETAIDAIERGVAA